MHVSSSEFADDPCSSVKRSGMVRAARALLSAVTRLLILADMVDVYLLLKSLRAVCHTVDNPCYISSVYPTGQKNIHIVQPMN